MRWRVFHVRTISKWKFNIRTGHESPDGSGYIYSSFNIRHWSSSTPDVDGSEVVKFTTRLPEPGMHPYIGDWVDPSRSGRVRNISPLPEFHPQTGLAGRSPFTATQTLWEKEVNLNFHWEWRSSMQSLIRVPCPYLTYNTQDYSKLQFTFSYQLLTKAFLQHFYNLYNENYNVGRSRKNCNTGSTHDVGGASP